MYRSCFCMVTKRWRRAVGTRGRSGRGKIFFFAFFTLAARARTGSFLRAAMLFFRGNAMNSL